MKHFITIIFLLICHKIVSQNFIKSDTLSEYPYEISKEIQGDIKMVRTIDFNGDKLLDYLVSVSDGDDNYRYWLLSNFQIIWKENDYSEDYYFEYYANLDDDIELEVFIASGYEDGIDYAFYDIDTRNKKKQFLFFFNPIIIGNKDFYWGYPWNIEDVFLKKTTNDKIRIYCSLNHNIIRDGNITIPKNQKALPTLFFRGDKKDKPIIYAIKERSWLTISEIKEKILIED